MDADLIDLVEFDHAEGFLAALSPNDARWSAADEWVFRGQDCSAWTLTPSIFRDSAWKETVKQHDEDPRFPMMRFVPEYQRVDQFFRAADKVGLAIPGDSHLLRAAHPIAQMLVRAAWRRRSLFTL